MRWVLVLFLTAFFLAPLAEAQIKLVKLAGNLDQPTDIVNAGDGSLRLFITLQRGKVVIYSNGRILTTPFLNISELVKCCGEQGLLSIAFHPNYKSNGLFYVYYVNTTNNLVLARFHVSATNKNIANKASKRIILTIDHPTYQNHNGGNLAFGKDGYLYLSVGDGGSAGDPNNNAQNLGRLLGKILRMDVNNTSTFSIPPGNPFVNVAGAKALIWAYGLRNTWRYTFDRLTGDMYIADVGQDSFEEVDFQPANSTGGENYGWRKMEGFHCYNPSSNCNSGGLTLPVLEYSHANGCSITGGYVYRGANIPTLAGTYLYGDFCSGIIWGAKNNSGVWSSSQLLSTGLNISTFGEGEKGELFVAHRSSPNGAIYKIVRP